MDTADSDLLADHALDELDLVHQEFMLFLETSQHELLALLVECLPLSEKLLHNGDLVSIAVNLLLIIKEDVVSGGQGRRKLELLDDAAWLRFDSGKFGDVNDEMDAVLLVVLSDVFDFVLLCHRLEHSPVVASPLTYWQLRNLELRL